MSYRAGCAIRCLSTLWVASLVALIAPLPRAHAASIVLGDVEYTREGRVDDEGRSAIEAYLEFFLSRLPHRPQDPKPRRIAQYLRECASGVQPKESDGSCAFPDFYIQLQIAERQGEAQISGAVAQKIESKNMRTYNLESIRVKMRDLTEGLSRIAKNINRIIAAPTASTEQIHVVIACFGSPFDSPDVLPARPKSSSRRRPVPTSTVSAYADRLPRALEAFMRDPPRMSVSINTDARAECGSLEGLLAIAQTAKADAVLSGRIFTDDQSGLIVLPYIFIPGASKKVALPVISVPRGANTAAFVPVGQEPDVVANPVISSKLRDVDTASYLLVAYKLGAATDVLIGSSKRAEFVNAINDGREVSFYLDRAKEHLSSSPPNYESADALLELAKSKAPRNQQTYLMLALSLIDRSRHKEAVTTLRLGLKEVSEVSERKALYIALAENLVRAEDLRGARGVYEEALSEGVLAEEALLGIARTYLLASPPDRSLQKAMEYALVAAERNPSSPGGYFLAGQITEDGNNFEQAEKYYQDARRISPESQEILSRLSSLYEHWVTKELGARRPDSTESAIRYLTKSIDVSPSVRKYYDRAQVYLDPIRTSDDRAQDYANASADYQVALQIARRDKNVLAQFPWLMPNLVEALILEGKFQHAKELARELFAILGSDSAIRPSTDAKEIRLIAAFLNAAAEILDTGSAEKELYLLENTALGMEHTRLSWSFDDMLSYLDREYPRIKSKSELPSPDRAARVAAVKQWIHRLKQ
jgi:tetratricopeptide (TPR) repeat protein